MTNDDLLKYFDDSYSDSIKGGEGDKKKPSDFSIKSLLKGMAVEFEHTDDVNKALEITIDHLSESDSYYDVLAKAEKAMSAEVDDFGIPTDK